MAEEEQLQLQLNSPAGSCPAVFDWPLIRNEVYDEGNDIAEMILIVMNDIYEDQGMSKDVVPADLKTTEYQVMKDMCDRFNELVATMENLKDGETKVKKRASQDALKNILNKIYNKSVPRPERLNKYDPFSPNTYGETSFEVIQEMLQKVKLEPTAVVVDLGSGVGQVVLQIAASVDVDLVCGIECAEIPNGFARNMCKNFRFWMEWCGFHYSEFKLIEDDFMKTEHRKMINNADLIFANNYAFGPELNFKLREVFLDQKPGSVIVSSLSFVINDVERITERNKDYLEVYLDNKRIPPIVGQVSWTGTLLTYHVQIYDINLAFERRRKFEDDKGLDKRTRKRNTNGNSVEEGESPNMDDTSRTSIAASSSWDSDETKDDTITVDGALASELSKMEVKVKLVDISPKSKSKSEASSPASSTVSEGGKKRNRRKAAIAGAVKTAAASANLDYVNDNGSRRSRGRPKTEESDGPMMRRSNSAEFRVKPGRGGCKVNSAGLAALEALHANTVRSYIETDQSLPGQGCIDERLQSTVREAAKLDISIPLNKIRLKNHPHLGVEPKPEPPPEMIEVKEENIEEEDEEPEIKKRYAPHFEDIYEKFRVDQKEKMFGVYNTLMYQSDNPDIVHALQMRIKRAEFQQDMYNHEVKTLSEGNKALTETIQEKLKEQLAKRGIPLKCATSLKAILRYVRETAKETQRLQKEKEAEMAKVKALEEVVFAKLQPCREGLAGLMQQELGGNIPMESLFGTAERLIAKGMQERIKANKTESKEIEHWLENQERMNMMRAEARRREVLMYPMTHEVASMPPPPRPPQPPPQQHQQPPQPPPAHAHAHAPPSRLVVPQMTMPDFYNLKENNPFTRPAPLPHPSPPPPRKAKKRSSAEMAAASSLEMLAAPHFAPPAHQHQQHHHHLPPPPPAHSAHRVAQYPKALDLGRPREENPQRMVKQEFPIMAEPHQALPRARMVKGGQGLPTQAVYSEDRVQSIITRCLNDSTQSAEETLGSQVPVGLLMSAPAAPPPPQQPQNYSYQPPVTTSPTPKASTSFFSPANWSRTAVDYSAVSPTKLALRHHVQGSPSLNPTVGDLVTSEVEKTLEISSQSIIDLAIDRSYKKPIPPNPPLPQLSAPTPSTSVAVEGLAACLLSNQPQQPEPQEQEYSFKHLDKRMRYQMAKASAVPAPRPTEAPPKPVVPASGQFAPPPKASFGVEEGLDTERDSTDDEFDRQFNATYNYAFSTMEQVKQRREQANAARAPNMAAAMAPPPPQPSDASGDDSCSSFSSSSAPMPSSSTIMLPKKKRLTKGTEYVTNLAALGLSGDSGFLHHQGASNQGYHQGASRPGE